MDNSFENHIADNMEEIRTLQKGLVNEMLQPDVLRFTEKPLSVSIKFPVLEWEANKVGNIHGGIIASIADMTAGVLARYCAGESFAPTASLDIKYVRPAKVGDVLVATARLVHAGRRIIQQTVDIVNMETGKTVATGAAMHLSADTDKEHRAEE